MTNISCHDNAGGALQFRVSHRFLLVQSAGLHQCQDTTPDDKTASLAAAGELSDPQQLLVWESCQDTPLHRQYDSSA